MITVVYFFNIVFTFGTNRHIIFNQDFKILIPPNANWIAAGTNIIAMDAIGSLSEDSAAGAGFTKTTIPPMMIKIPEIIIRIPNRF